MNTAAGWVGWSQEFMTNSATEISGAKRSDRSIQTPKTISIKSVVPLFVPYSDHPVIRHFSVILFLPTADRLLQVLDQMRPPAPARGLFCG